MTISNRAPAAPVWTRKDGVVLAAVLGLAIALLWPDLFRGWAPADDGGLAQVAERVLRGQMPHRDFDDPWTGGWSYLQAAIFRLFGSSLSVVRLPIFLAWLTGMVAAYGLMRRLALPLLAGGVTLACGLWSLYAWRFSLLSWYYFPLALITCWCAVRYSETRRRYWLLAAGFFIGISLLVKITAVFLLAGVLLWLLAVASEMGEASTTGPGSFIVVVAGVLLVFLAGVVLLIRGLPTDMQGAASIQFLLPQLLLAGWLFRNALARYVSFGAGLRCLLRLVAPLLGGVVLALLPYVSLFAFTNALHALVAGLLVNPRMRLLGYALGPPGRLGTALALLAPIVLIAGSRFVRIERTRRELLLAVLCGAGLGALAHISDGTAGAMALSVRSIPIVLPLVALWWEGRTVDFASSRSVAMLLVMVAVTSQLTQIPYSSFVYFLYVAPLGIVATIALMRVHLRHAPIAAFWTAMLLVAGAFRPVTEPTGARAALSWHPMALPRAGLQVSLLDSVRYGRLAKFMADQPAGPIFVLGGHPELPFLLERPSGSRIIYDAITDSAALAPARLIWMLDSSVVRTVIIVHEGRTRGELVTPQIAVLREAFTAAARFGPFEILSRKTVR